MKNKVNYLKLLILAVIFLFSAFFASGHYSSSDVYVRVVSADPSSRTHTFSCIMDPENNLLRDWFIRPDHGDFSMSESEEATFLDKPSGQHLTYTFKENLFYHIGCLVVDTSTNPAKVHRGDLHIDLRASGWNPEVIPVSGNGLSSTLKCQHSTTSTPSWEVINAYTGARSGIGTGNQITHSVSGHGLFDYICNVGGKSTGLPVEYFDSGNPYFPDNKGIPHGIKNVWHRGSTTSPSEPTNPPSSGNCFSNVQNAPATCKGGTIVEDNFNGCRNLKCASDSDSLAVLACDKPSNENPSYFEMYKQSKIGSLVSEICLGSTCISDNGYAKSTNYPICSGSDSGTGDTGTQQPPPSTSPGTCFSNVQNIPTSCSMGSVSQDSFNGCRTLTCSSGGSSHTILACDKPSSNDAQYFEIYRQSQTGELIQVCLGSTCLKENGYVKSSNYQFCAGDTSTPPPQQPPQEQQSCFSSIDQAQVTCDGGTITSDVFSGCRSIICSSASSTMKVLACDKPSNENPSYLEIYKQNQQGNDVKKICFGSVCISEAGFVKSNNYPICSGGSSGSSTQPIWLEPSAGNNNVDVFDFHMQVFPPQTSMNHIATDFEIWDDAANQRVWSSLFNTQILYHIHNGDGKFEGTLAGQNKLKYGNPHRVRARFYFENNVVGPWSEWRYFRTRVQQNIQGGNILWSALSGYSVQLVASGISTPVNIEMAPNTYTHLSEGQRPLLYVTQLYGQIGMIRKDGTYVKYADNLLNYQSFGSIPGSGETGVTGLYVDPATGDLFVSMVYHQNNQFFGKVDRFISNNNGDGFTSRNTILSNIPVAPSHQVQSITRGPDGKLYLNTGDNDKPGDSKNTGIYSGKILRFNEDGSNPGDNPFGNLVYAAGFRNPFGAAWRPNTNELFVTENGPDSDDSLHKVMKGNIKGWCCDTGSSAWQHWPQTVVPTQVAFDKGNSGFPIDSKGSMYAVLMGATYAAGPHSLGKRIVQFNLNADGTKQSVNNFAVYTGNGYGTPLGITFGSDGLYFTDIYGEQGFVGAGVTKGNIYKVVPGGAGTSPSTGSGFSAVIAPRPWYPKGLEMIWECKPSGGSGNYIHKFTFGDGVSTGDQASNTAYHKYSASGTYTATCTVRDLSFGKTVIASTSITLGNEPK